MPSPVDRRSAAESPTRCVRVPPAASAPRCPRSSYPERVSSDESPFASVPDPDAGPRPAPLTYEGQLANVGASSTGLRGRPPWIRWTVRVVGGLFALLAVAAIVASLFT